MYVGVYLILCDILRRDVMNGSIPPILSQLQPFNESRFDACMAFMSIANSCVKLTMYDMVKLHVMIDLYHTARHGRPVIGGSLDAWKFGPLIPDAYNRLRHWAYKFEEDGFQPENFDIVERRNRTVYFKPTIVADIDDFSPSEVWAMTESWSIVMKQYKDWSRSQEYFHQSCSPIGEAWKDAWEHETPIDWRKLLDAWARHEHTDLSDLKQIVSQ